MHRIHNIMFFENYYALFSWYAHPVRVPIGLKSTLIQDAAKNGLMSQVTRGPISPFTRS
jgi:hypothetical protein